MNERCINTWQRILTDYEIKEWNDQNSPLVSAYCREAYRRGLWSRLSNYVRLHALYAEGGIYLDTDVEVLKDFEPLLSNKCFLGFQQNTQDADWVNSAVLGGQAGNPFIKRCLDMTESLYAEGEEFVRGPLVITNILKSMGLVDYGLQEIDGVKIYPAEYFYPYPWFSQFSPDCVKENTFCIHHWEGSWLKQLEKDAFANQPLQRWIFAIRRRIYTTTKRVWWARGEQLRQKVGRQ